MTGTKPSRAKALIEWCQGRGIKKLKYKDIEVEFYPSLPQPEEKKARTFREEMEAELGQELSAEERREAQQRRNQELLYWSA
jgi:hypothetical protein